MRLRRLEFAVIALTLAFICFMGGYFAGRRGAINIVTVASQNGDALAIHAGAALYPSNEGENSGSGGAAAANPESARDSAGANSAATAPGEPDPTAAPVFGDNRININLASRNELTDLPGIGDVLAGRIVDYRQQNGPFLKTEDIKNVSGIGEKRYEAIQSKITVG